MNLPASSELIYYKYLMPERETDLENNSYRFSQTEALNDPFEVYPDFTEYEATLREYSRLLDARESSATRWVAHETERRSYVEKAVEDLRRNIRQSDRLVFCLSRDSSNLPSNLLMWSHYTDCFQGFAIGFDGKHEYFKQNVPSHTSQIFQVDYSTERPQFPSSNNLITEESIQHLLLTKSIDWKYEHEFRMFANSKACRATGKNDDKGLEIYVFEFPVDCVRYIILGFNMEAKRKSRMIELVKLKFPFANVFEARPSKTRFAVDIDRF